MVFATQVLCRLGIEDVNEDSGPGRRVGFPHDVFNVFLDSLFSDLKSVCDLFVRPSLSQMFNNGLFAIR